jgi:protein-disulfide isomerase
MSPAESKKSTKEKAAAARAAAEAEQRKRDRRVRIVGGVAILVVVGLIIGLGVWGSQQKGPNDIDVAVVADATVPTGVNGADGDNPWGVPYNAAAGAPTLAIWEDFQCPACAALEERLGDDIVKLADDGKINLVWRPTSFLDERFLTGPNPRSSLRAAAAWGCAIDAEQKLAYHDIIFANQPAVEGDGWSDQQLLDFGKQAGIEGDAYSTFETCFNDRVYQQWGVNSYATFQADNVPGTPALYLNGTEVPTTALTDIATLEKWIDENK